MIYKVDFEGQACKQIKEKAESYQYDLKSVLKGIGLLIADMWLPGDSKPQINTWEGLFEKVQEDYSYKDTIVENDFICSISNDDGISIIIEIADETIVDFKDIKSSILQVRDFLLANKWSGAIPDFLPIEQKEIRNMMNETERSIPFKCLHEAFFECAYRFPDKTALEWLSLDEKWETLSYEALKIKVLQTASMLKQEGVHTRDKVAIVLPKGENQIIAVLAILSIGATYVPIGIHQPLDRKKKIFEAGNISYALTDRDHINTLDGADTLRSFLIENSFRYVVMPETEIVKDIDSIAYIIFTSGTTGIPKGVMITHKAAYNTIYDVNDKFTINEHDCAIAVSELDFDLSVYDIFGMLGYGASLIVLNEMNKREPYIWKKILCEKRVTIWNSVPALFEMFLLAIGYDYEKVTLKNILLSGDWIKLEIYPKVNKLWPECRFVSLGGATEAAIWSVYYEVHILDEPWTSIPYGRPLANQLLRVVNNKGKDSPVGVPGELWIGGYGVAEGYVNEEKLTQERFVKIDGIRWYKTGDKAQYFQDGNVQFLGRLDDQVKVNGYRIELGEIENVIKRAECIDDAIAMTVETNGKKEIVAAVVEKYEKGNASHQVFMNEENPEYAEIQEIRKKVVAAFILKVYGNNVDSLTPNDNIVINSNGKVEQYWNVWLLINNVISHKDSDEYVLNLEIKNVLSDIWYMKLETQIPMVQELIRGTVSASNLLTNGYLSPEELLVQGSDTVIFLEHVTKVIKHDSLLYPDGSNKYTQALYVENTATKYINASICKIIKKVQKRVPGQKIKILEVGAGTGATTEWVFKALEGSEFEYCFTDISKYFFPDAVNRFGKNPNVTIKKLDLNEDFVAQGFCPNSYDVIIGAYVLNNVKDIVKTINKLKELVRNEGYLIFSETILPETWLLVSQALMMTPPEDTLRDGAAFISKDLWCGVLKESDGVEESVLSIPSNNNPTSLLGAGLFIKQFKRTDVFLDKMEINRRLEKYLPAYMLPSEICIIDRIPLSANGKIDRKAVEDWFERYRISEDKIAEKEETKTDLEKMICQIWCEALDIGDLGRKENFYDYGADSLIMAQVTTKVRSKLEKEIPFDALLRQMLNTPTIEEIALYISAYDNQEIESPMCEKKFEYIAKNGERNGNRGRILLHGALGSVDVYRYLIPEMEKQNCGEIISIGISDLDEYCKLESEEVVLHLADLYTQKILEENLDKVQIVGYSFSGVIAIEMAKQLLEAGIDVEDVAIIDGGSIPVEIQDEIIYELFFIGNLHVSLEKLEFTDLKVFEKIFGKIVDSKQDSISISDFEDSQEDCHIYERLLELSQLTQEVRFKTYLSVSDDSSVRNFNFDMVKHLYTIFKKSFAALRFVPTVYFGDIRYFKTTERNGIFKYFEALLQEWDDVCIGDFEIIEIAGNHYSCLENPNYAHELAKKLGSVYEEWREE